MFATVVEVILARSARILERFLEFVVDSSEVTCNCSTHSSFVWEGRLGVPLLSLRCEVTAGSARRQD